MGDTSKPSEYAPAMLPGETASDYARRVAPILAARQGLPPYVEDLEPVLRIIRSIPPGRG